MHEISGTRNIKSKRSNNREIIKDCTPKKINSLHIGTFNNLCTRLRF